MSSLKRTDQELARLQKRVAGLTVLQEVAQSLTAELDPDRLLRKILCSAVQVVDACAGSLLLYDPATQTLKFEVVEGGGGAALQNQRIPSDQGIAGCTFTQRQPIIVRDVTEDQRFLKGFDESYGFHTTSLIAVPLMRKGEALGVLEIMNKKSGEYFDEDDQDLLLALASQSAIAIENARLYQTIIEERDRIAAVEEAVRHELARDLHDGPSQILSAIIMSLRFLKEVIQRAPDRVPGELTELEVLAQKALYQVRNMLFDLRPVVLETQGLRAALESYVERQRLVETLNLHLEVAGLTARLAPKAEAAIFAIVQEAVNNARKHAAARNVWIRATQIPAQMTLIVQDDGRGFDVAQVENAYAKRGSMGLLNMRERAEIAHAKLSIESAEGKGTRVTLTVPL